MAINKAEWAEIESKIANVDQAGITKKHELFVKDMNKQIGDCVDKLSGIINKKIIEIDEEAKKREALFKKDRFSSTLDSVLNVLENHGYDYRGYITSILKYTSKYCEMQEKHESYAEWCKTREQGLSARAAKKTNNKPWDEGVIWDKD